MYCLTRDKPKPIRLPDDDSDSDRLLEDIYALDEKVDEKAVADVPSEDEMQDRLKSLRKAIRDAKLDW